LSGNVPNLAWGHEKTAEHQQTSNGLYNWGTDTDTLSLENKTGSSVTYTITFYFDGSAPPNPSDLFLIVVGLSAGNTGTGTTATIVAGATPSAPGKNVGEYSFPGTNCACSGSAPTIFSPSTLTFRSGYDGPDDTDLYNTGWDLYQPNNPSLSFLQIQVTQVAGDGIGFTLGYRVCTTLVGLANEFGPGYNSPTLYDISTTYGWTSNPRPTSAAWGLAFSPVSARGTLYAASTKALSTVDLANGLNGSPTTFLPPPPSFLYSYGGGLTSDPLSGALYAIDYQGDLLTGLPGNPLSAVGKLHGSIPLSYPNSTVFIVAMAVDNSGNLWVVDTGNGYLLKVNAGSAQAIGGFKLSPRPVESLWAALAIDPWSGTAYYADGSNSLYNLDLGTGALAPIGSIIGSTRGSTEWLNGLAFTVGACPAPPSPIQPDQTVMVND